MGLASLLGLVVGLVVWLVLTALLISYLRGPYRTVDEALRPYWVAATIFTVACMALGVGWIAVLVGLVVLFSDHPGPAWGIVGLTICALAALAALEMYDGRTTATARALRRRVGLPRSGAHRAPGVEHPGTSSRSR